MTTVEGLRKLAARRFPGQQLTVALTLHEDGRAHATVCTFSPRPAGARGPTIRLYLSAFGATAAEAIGAVIRKIELADETPSEEAR